MIILQQVKELYLVIWEKYNKYNKIILNFKCESPEVSVELKNLLNINKGCMVSIAGAGGKTTLMFTLAEELRDNKTLVTTTTKIYEPAASRYDFIAIGQESFSKIKGNSSEGIYIYGSSISKEGKLVGVRPDELKGLDLYFDFILVEADGSKEKSIKGWNETEPVICSDTAKTIGVLSIENIGKQVNENNVHRLKEFINISGSRENQPIEEEHIASMIFHKSGLFKNSSGERILFINKADMPEQMHLAENLAEYIKERNKTLCLIDRIIIGSLKYRCYIEK